MVMLVIVLLHLLFLRNWVAACITCSAEAVYCAGEFFAIIATIAFIVCLVLRSTGQLMTFIRSGGPGGLLSMLGQVIPSSILTIL